MVDNINENNVTQRTEEIGVEVVVPETANEVVPLNHEAALASLTEAERKEILDLADSIDVTQIDKVMSYGAAPLKTTFEQCGKFLKDERGSHADQEVINQVVELSKKASESNDELNLVLQEPGLFQKLLLKLFKSKRDSRTDKIQKSAITNYNLLVELKESCDSWLDMLKDAMGEIEYSALSDVETIQLLEKYIIAGRIADERIKDELAVIQSQHKDTGLQKHAYYYEALKEGYDLFNRRMLNLEQSRDMYYLSLGQLALIKRSNRNVQSSIHTQVENSMALMGQQLRNAVLNAKTREVLEGQKAIARLNDELIKDISKTVGLTAEDTEKLIYSGFYSVEAAKEAVTTVINSCNAIKKTANEMLPKMKADMTQLNELIEQLEPCVASVDETLKIEEKKSPTGDGKLQF